MKALILLCLSVCAAALRAQAPDSLTTEKYINRIFVAYPDSALALIERDAARPKPQIADFKADMLRAMCYEVKSEYATKTRYCLRALQHDSVRLVSRRRLRLLGMTASALSADGKQEECIAHCRQAIELARQLGNRKAEAGTLITMGRAHTLMKQTEQALAYYREAAALLEGSDDVRELAELSTAYGECMTALLDLGQTAEAIATGKRREALIARMSEMAGPPAGYIDQQYGFVRAKLAYALQRNGQQAEAAEVYRRFEGTRFAQTLLGRQYGTAYLQEAGRHREALALTEECVQRMDTDTLNQNYLIALNNYAQAYRGMKQYAMADGYAQRYIALQETLHTRQMESRAQEYATLFSLGEKELELSRSRALSERKTLMLIGAAVATSLLIIIIVIVGMNLHKTRKKNRVIARQIDELLHSRDALRQAYSTEDIKEGTLLPPPVNICKSDTYDNKSNTDETVRTDDYQLFMRMERTLMEQKLFLQGDLGRDELAQLTHINKKKISALILEHTGEQTIKNYLNRLRAEYAVRLMKERKNLSIDAIAEEASFNSRSTFYRTFYKVFGMTPTQYLEAEGDVPSVTGL